MFAVQSDRLIKVAQRIFAVAKPVVPGLAPEANPSAIPAAAQATKRIYEGKGAASATKPPMHKPTTIKIGAYTPTMIPVAVDNNPAAVNATNPASGHSRCRGTL